MTYVPSPRVKYVALYVASYETIKDAEDLIKKIEIGTGFKDHGVIKCSNYFKGIYCTWWKKRNNPIKLI